MLCGPDIGIVSSFSESGFGRSNHYVLRGFSMWREVSS